MKKYGNQKMNFVRISFHDSRPHMRLSITRDIVWKLYDSLEGSKLNSTEKDDKIKSAKCKMW